MVNYSVTSRRLQESDSRTFFMDDWQKNNRDQMSDRIYKYIRLVDEKKRNTNDLKGQQLGFMSYRCICRGPSNS